MGAMASQITRLTIVYSTVIQAQIKEVIKAPRHWRGIPRPLAGNSPPTDEFPSQRPVMRSFGVFFDLHLNQRLSKQPWGWWLETPSRSLWRHHNDYLSMQWRHISPARQPNILSSQIFCPESVAKYDTAQIRKHDCTHIHMHKLTHRHVHKLIGPWEMRL